MSKKTITQNNLPTFWNKVQAYINDRLPKGALAAKDVANVQDGGTGATNAKDARVNLGITYGTEVPTETPETGSGAIYFFVDEEDIDDSGVADYIVEQGTSGIWTYRKWNSGIAECWGTWTSTVTPYSSTFYLIPKQMYPFNFIESPVESCAVKASSGSGHVEVSYGYVDGFAAVVNANFTTEIPITVRVRVIGRWK